MTELGGGMVRVNLLPPEIAEKRRTRRMLAGLVVGLAGFIVVLVALALFHRGQLSSAEDALAQQQATNRELQTKVVSLQEYGRLDQLLTQKKTMLAQALQAEVRWSTILRDVSMLIPGDTWLTSFSGAVSATAVLPAGQAVSIGTLSFSGVSFDYLGVAGWLVRMGEGKQFANPYLSNTTKADLAGRKVANFSSTIDLTPAAFTRRYAVPTASGGAK
ncbi:MAG: PilN domain-containing protein [Actinomycetota bacterium]